MLLPVLLTMLNMVNAQLLFLPKNNRATSSRHFLTPSQLFPVRPLIHVHDPML